MLGITLQPLDQVALLLIMLTVYQLVLERLRIALVPLLRFKLEQAVRVRLMAT